MFAVAYPNWFAMALLATHSLSETSSALSQAMLSAAAIVDGSISVAKNAWTLSRSTTPEHSAAQMPGRLHRDHGSTFVKRRVAFSAPSAPDARILHHMRQDA